jgi:predicted DNA-binding mobile mystery protein A
MRNQKKLLIEQIDRKLHVFAGAENVPVPSKGWIYSIRKALNMTLEQIGEQLNMSKQGVQKMEVREASGSITLKSIKEIASALNMHFVYGFVPKNGSLENLINQRAEDLARRIVLRTNQTMILEEQGNDEQQIKQAIRDLAEEIKREMPKSLWD